MPGAVFLEGELVELRTVEEEDLEFLRDAINDPRVWQTLGAYQPKNLQQEREWFESVGEGDGVGLLVCVDGEAVGSIGLHEVNEVWGRAEAGYWITPDAQGNGYATDALATLVEYAFDELRLHKVYAHAYETNPASRRVLEKVGFREEGLLREAAFVDGEYVDLYRYGLLEGEWRGEV